MSALGPREVEPDAWSEWVREAVRLLKGQAAWAGAVLAVVLVVFYAVHQVEWMPVRRFAMFLCLPLALMVFIRLAWFADHGRQARVYQLVPRNTDLLLAVGCAATLMALHGALAMMLDPLAGGFHDLVEQTGLWSPIRADGLPAEPPLRQTLLGPILIPGGLFGTALVAMLLVLLAFGQWFLLAMTVLHHPPLPPAMGIGLRAYAMNPVPMMGVTGLLMIAAGLLAVSVGWLFLLFVPFFGALMYVSYRDVFLGSESDAPEQVEEEQEIGEEWQT